jgi:hypothetical protein
MLADIVAQLIRQKGPGITTLSPAQHGLIDKSWREWLRQDRMVARV